MHIITLRYHFTMSFLFRKKKKRLKKNCYMFHTVKVGHLDILTQQLSHNQEPVLQHQKKLRWAHDLQGQLHLGAL